MFIATALIFALLAVLSGLIAVGSGKDWKFTIKDIARGQQNALLYVWVTFSTMFSLAHVTAITGWILTDGFNYRHFDTAMWFAMHTAVGILMVAAHVYIKVLLGDPERDFTKQTLWT